MTRKGHQGPQKRTHDLYELLRSDFLDGQTIHFGKGLTYVIGKGWFLHGKPKKTQQIPATLKRHWKAKKKGDGNGS